MAGDEFWALACGGAGMALCLAAAITSIIGAFRRTGYEMLPRYTGWSVSMLVVGCLLLITSLILVAVSVT